MYWSAGCSLLRAEGFFCSLEILYAGLGIGKLYFLIQNFLFSAVTFLQFFVIKTLDPHWIQIGIHPKMLDPKPYQMNTDPKHCPWDLKCDGKGALTWMCQERPQQSLYREKSSVIPSMVAHPVTSYTMDLELVLWNRIRSDRHHLGGSGSI